MGTRNLIEKKFLARIYFIRGLFESSEHVDHYDVLGFSQIKVKRFLEKKTCRSFLKNAKFWQNKSDRFFKKIIFIENLIQSQKARVNLKIKVRILI